jgi:hypothetical protein
MANSPSVKGNFGPAALAKIARKEAEFYDSVIGTGSGNRFVRLWIGPVDAKEIERALAGTPRIVDCAVGPNLNDGSSDGSFYIKHKGFMRIRDMEYYLKEFQPDEPVFPCLAEGCDYVGTSKNDTAAHMKTHIGTPDYTDSKKAKLEKELTPKEEGVKPKDLKKKS